MKIPENRIPMSYERLKYGLFVHYIASNAPDSHGVRAENVDRAADDFDVPRFAAEVRAMGVEYVIFTAWHWLMQPLYPSAVTELWRPGNSVRRDLIGEIIDALKAEDISVILYTHPRDGHDFDSLDRARTGWGEGYDPEVPFGDHGSPSFDNFDYEKWNRYVTALYGELAQRYGSRIDGIWLDGMGPGRFMYGHLNCQSYEYPIVDYLRVRSIIKAANPRAAIIHNMNGERFNCDFVMPEGYYGVEYKIPNALWPACEKALAFCPFSDWAPSKPKGPDRTRLSAETLFPFFVLQSTCTSGGGLCLAASPYRDGEWETGATENLRRLGAMIASLGESIRGTVPSPSWETVAGDTLESRDFVCACTSEDGKYEFIHILRRDGENEHRMIVLPPPEDSAGFSDPEVIVGNAVIGDFSFGPEGLKIELDRVGDAPDTVIRLRRGGPCKQYGHYWLNCTEKEIVYSGEWEYNCFCDRKRWVRGYYENDERICDRPGERLTFSFDGDIVEIYGPKRLDRGQADVLIDGMKAGELDEFSDKPAVRQLLFRSGDLYGGRHTLSIVKTGGGSFSFDAARIIRLR